MLKDILSNIPALIIAIPMFFAPVVAMIPSTSKFMRVIIWQVVNLCIGLMLAGATYLFIIVYQTGPFSYFFGAWSPPVGIEYEATKLNTLLMLLISIVAFVLLPYARSSVETEIKHKKTGLFYAVFLLLVAGLMGMVITNDIFNIYVFLEISSLATYALVAMGPDRRALTASFNYLIVGTIGGTLFLAGIGFLYILTGSLNISDISYQLGLTPHNKVEVAAVSFLFIGLAIKCAIVPLAGWLPRAYQYAPGFVTAFIAAVSTKVALYLLAKVFYVLFGKDLALGEYAFESILVVLAVISIFYGGIAACMQTDFKRVLAFSSISNIGYIVLGIGIGSRAAVTAGVLLFVAHAFAKAGLFVVAGISKNNVRGLRDASPLLAGFLVLFGLSIIGVPLTFGFIPKWYLLLAASGLNGWIQVVSFIGIIGGSLLSIVYVWRLVELAYTASGREPIKIGYYSTSTLVTLAILTIYFGASGSPIAGYVSELAGEFAK